jgi:hypothetical protein
MHALAGTTYIEIGGKKRPLRFGINQCAKFSELRGIELGQVGQVMANLADFFTFRDVVYSGLWAGARFEKMDVDFDNETIGFWMEEIDLQKLTVEVSKAIQGEASPNGKAQEKKPKQSR